MNFVRNGINLTKNLQKKTMEKINEIRSELEKTTSSLLDEQSGENNDSIALLKQQYEINHTKVREGQF